MIGRKAAVVVVAAGRGERAGQASEGPKQYRRIGGQPVITHTLQAFATHPSIGAIVVVIHKDDEALLRTASAAVAADRIVVVQGGATRQASTLAGLRALQDHEPAAVLVHDAVRPFVDHALVSRVLDAVDDMQGALPAVAVSDTLKRAEADGRVGATISREGLHAAQTPQGFPYRALLAAHEKAAAANRQDFTDDAAIAEWAGIAVKLVEGSADNAKLTWAKDIEMADLRLNSTRGSLPDVRTGNGYDVHIFEPGDHVTLCGVAIPYDRKLCGHSDADVGLHALTDALLATCGAGDIGTHFPPSDARWKGAESRIFVEHAADFVRSRGGRIANADVTLVCEAPKIAPHREAMVEQMASMLGISRDRVSVKATTNEGVGFVGRGEGIAAIATASVIFPGEVPE